MATKGVFWFVCVAALFGNALCYFIPTINQAETNITCGASVVDIKLVFDAGQYITGSKYYVSPDLRNVTGVYNTGCKATNINGNVIEFSFAAGNCRPSITEDDYYFNYTYMIWRDNRIAGSLFSRSVPSRYNLTCMYERNSSSLLTGPLVAMMESMNISMLAHLKIHGLPSPGFQSSASNLNFGKIGIFFDTFLDDNLNTTIGDGDATILRTSFVQFSVNMTGSGYVLQTTDCYATNVSFTAVTPTTYKYQLVTNGCASQSNVIVPPPSNQPSTWFAFEAIKWEATYVSCDVSVCSVTDPTHCNLTC